MPESTEGISSPKFSLVENLTLFLREGSLLNSNITDTEEGLSKICSALKHVQTLFGDSRAEVNPLWKRQLFSTTGNKC